MKIVKPSFEVRRVPIDALEDITDAGSTCYKSSPESAEQFVKFLLKRGHESVIEHIYASVRIVCDRGVSHEIVRHRLASYSQESTRYCNYSKDKFDGHVTFIRPCFFFGIPIGTFSTMNRLNGTKFREAEKVWCKAMLTAEESYLRMLKEGCKPEQARSVLPNSLKTEIVMTANVREWRHFFKMRTSKAAHPQMREIAIPMLQEFRQLMPIVFDDVGRVTT